MANFVLHGHTADAEIPDWPHIVCADGYAWHPDPRRRQCFRGLTAGAPAELVAGVLEGRPIERVWAVRRLLVGAEPGDPHWPGVIVLLWPDPCDGCGKSHLKDAFIWRRAAMSIHPGALDDLRRADPPLRQLLAPNMPPDRKYNLKWQRVRSDGIPVRSTPAATERAQISWALDLAARREFPLTVRRPRRRIVRDVAG